MVLEMISVFSSAFDCCYAFVGVCAFAGNESSPERRSTRYRKGDFYFAIAFSLMVESLDIRAGREKQR